MTENTPIQIAILAPTLAVRVGLRTLLGVSDSVQIVAEMAEPAALQDVEWDVFHNKRFPESLNGWGSISNTQIIFDGICKTCLMEGGE